ncbi:TonB-dependent hemoglobin/transferrin/lactoferrin family receptor [Sansalvadorimonas verongulae]|uniref:TonB-dependent hemoglobin/transferrin/lactoferrin family receptor n=1 Tax=Sansalvadorimonas verongulae TaxID=2172824 RepID=UPI0012BC08D4|nr:TonB-dependent hemoglobin/transferrin/lactoferrin family receptor [Sansalvadorimonas verongulae]MTI13626.1 TonB-dependent hemoglobin/transferrin/lactoferrin family receptor [Sansalvadorimonas verongulae]
MKFRGAPLSVAIAAALSANVFAESQATQYDNATLLNQVTVTATRTEKSLKDVPHTVSIIDAESIETDMANNIRDLIQYEPGVEVGSDDRFGLKGFNIRGLSEDRVKILLDGVDQMNTFDSSGPFLRSHRDFIDIDSLKSVEIVKGPGSTLYGSDALGGVVAFTTKDAADFLSLEGDENYFSVKSAYSSKDEGFTENLTFANRNGKLESLLSYTRRDSKETKNFSGANIQGTERGRPNSSDNSSNNILGKISYQLNKVHTVKLTADYLDQNSKSDMEKSASLPDHSDDSKKRKRVTVAHEWFVDSHLVDNIDTQLTWQETETNQITYTYGSTNREKDYTFTQGGLQFSTQFQKALSFGATDHQLTWGFSAEKESVNNKNVTTLLDTGVVLPPDEPHQPARYAPKVERKALGIFLQDEISLLDDQLSLIPGVRYDTYKISPETDELYAIEQKASKDSAATAKLGSVYNINDTVSIFAQYSQGFRGPTLEEIYYSFENLFGPSTVPGIKPGYAALSNPDLKPETSDSWELGLRLSNINGSAEVTGFYNNYRNFIENQPVDNSGYQFGATRNENVSRARIKGIELRGEIWLDQLIGAPTGMSFKTAIAYTKGENLEKGTPLESISPMKGLFGLAYDSPEEDFGGALNWTLSKGKKQSDIENSKRFETSGYGIVDLTTYYKLLENLTLRAGLFNITDKEYWLWEDVRTLSKSGRSPVSPSAYNAFSQPGRNFSMSAKYAF